MILDDIQRQLTEIKRFQHDDEVAHGLEDDLYRQLLAAIAEGRCLDPRKAAALALTSRQSDFARWMA